MYLKTYWGLAVFTIVIAALTAACGVSAGMNIKADSSAEASIVLDMPLALEAKIKQLSGTSGVSSSAAIFNAEDIRASLSAMGATVKESKAINSHSYKGVFYVSELERFLKTNKSLNSILYYERGHGYALIKFSLNRNNAKAILGLFPLVDENLLEALQVPAFYDNPVSSSEYRTMLGGLLGKTAAAAIDDVYFKLLLDLPGPITEVSGPVEAISGKRSALFSAKIIDAMVLEEPLSFYIKWKE